MFINKICFTVYEPCTAGQHCQNGGSCDRLEEDYRCWCSDEFAGKRCEGERKHTRTKTYWALLVFQRGVDNMMFLTDIYFESECHTSRTMFNLGVTFDDNFNFKQHMSKVCRCCFYHMCNVSQFVSYTFSCFSPLSATSEIIALGPCVSIPLCSRFVQNPSSYVINTTSIS